MENIYFKLRDFFNSMPNGFPPSKSGIEIEILKMIFTEEEAEMFMKLKLSFETPEKISKRTGLDMEYLKRILPVMDKKGQVFGVSLGAVSFYKILPYVFGVYEFQLGRMNKRFAELNEEYGNEVFSEDFFSKTPPLMRAIPIGVEVKDDTKIEPYESVASLIESAKSWGVRDCICKTEKSLLDKRCDKPLEVCMSFAPVEHAFDNAEVGRAITKEEAYEILKTAEDAGLVHMTSNVKSGQYYICNCCKCCCGPLSKYIAVSKNAAAKSSYVAVVDNDACISCGVCIDRCQADAIEMADYAVITDCLGCGLCVSTCPTNAIKLQKRRAEDIQAVPENESEWMELRAKGRGMGDDYKKLF
ncbi:MAG: 4Fe-4S ferredoxin [Spirochaetae bacterium HGW-Spirochaetae-5]|nr:MAG: 4Fe-4S ferredoxin [Spirochaetae bacterium HGW-Spirochaetae-5]